jgi:hypothetical protein
MPLVWWAISAYSTLQVLVGWVPPLRSHPQQVRQPGGSLWPNKVSPVDYQSRPSHCQDYQQLVDDVNAITPELATLPTNTRWKSSNIEFWTRTQKCWFIRLFILAILRQTLMQGVSDGRLAILDQASKKSCLVLSIGTNWSAVSSLLKLKQTAMARLGVRSHDVTCRARTPRHRPPFLLHNNSATHRSSTWFPGSSLHRRNANPAVPRNVNLRLPPTRVKLLYCSAELHRPVFGNNIGVRYAKIDHSWTYGRQSRVSGESEGFKSRIWFRSPPRDGPLIVGPRCILGAGHTVQKWVDWRTVYTQVLILGRDWSRWASDGSSDGCLSGSQEGACPA